jgi:hypothetical protein
MDNLTCEPFVTIILPGVMGHGPPIIGQRRQEAESVVKQAVCPGENHGDRLLRELRRTYDGAWVGVAGSEAAPRHVTE